MEKGRAKGDTEDGRDRTGHGVGQGGKGKEKGEESGYSPKLQFLAPPLIILMLKTGMKMYLVPYRLVVHDSNCLFQSCSMAGQMTTMSAVPFSG